MWEQINSDLLAARQDVRSIFVTFKDVRGESYDSLYTTIRSAFINVVFDYEQLYGQFKQTYGDFIVHVDSPGQAQLQKLLTGFVDFIRFLAKHLRCKFVILLDEYDKILLDAASSVEAYGRDYFETILGVYRNFLSALFKDTPFVERVLLTGVLPLAANSVMSAFNYHDLSAENAYHMWVLGMLTTLKETYHVTSNREAGNVRFDIAVTPTGGTNLRNYVFEFKKSSSLKKLKADADSALLQVKSQRYFKYFNNRYDVVVIGMSGFKKSICVKIQEYRYSG